MKLLLLVWALCEIAKLGSCCIPNGIYAPVRRLEGREAIKSLKMVGVTDKCLTRAAYPDLAYPDLELGNGPLFDQGDEEEFMRFVSDAIAGKMGFAWTEIDLRGCV